jgi:hypothetical protein
MAVKITGLNDLKRRLERMANALDKIMDYAFIEVNNARTEIIYEMRNTPKTGRSYSRQRGRRTHIASSQGNAPAIDGGALVRSLIIDRNTASVEMGSIIQNPEYPLFLEKGTTKMGERPFMEPAFNNMVNRFKMGIGRLKI